MDWREIDEKLIQRGILILDLDFLDSYREELEAANSGKVGPSYRLAPSYIKLLAMGRYLYGIPYRQLEGFTSSLHRLVPQLPPGD